MGGQCVGGAFGPDRAGTAERLGLQLPPVAGGAAFPVRVEELRAVTAAAQPQELPIPDIGDRTGEPAYVGHRGSLLYEHRSGWSIVGPVGTPCSALLSIRPTTRNPTKYADDP